MEREKTRLERLLASDAWQEECRPAIEARLKAVQHRLCTGEYRDLTEVQADQEQWKLYHALLNDPVKFFSLRGR